MAMLDQVPTLPARFGVGQAMYCGRYGIKTVSYTALQPDPRARSKVHAQRRRSEKSVSGACVPTAGMKAHGRANRLIDLVLRSTIDHTQRVFTKRTSCHGRFFPPDPLSRVLGVACSLCCGLAASKHEVSALSAGPAAPQKRHKIS